MTDKNKSTELSETELDEVRGAGNAVPTESISLNYEKITWTYNRSADIKDGTSNTLFVGERNS